MLQRCAVPLGGPGSFAGFHVHVPRASQALSMSSAQGSASTALPDAVGANPAKEGLFDWNKQVSFSDVCGHAIRSVAVYSSGAAIA